MSVNFAPPSASQQAQVQPVEGYETHGYLITLGFGGGRLVFSTFWAQSLVQATLTLRHGLATNLSQAGDGQEGVEAYGTFKPDVVVMDGLGDAAPGRPGRHRSHPRTRPGSQIHRADLLPAHR